MTREQESPEASMSYPMIIIGSGAGHLAAAIYSAIARGMRLLFVPVRVIEHQQSLVATPVRSRAS
jgi:thioredoxin reductase